MGLFTQYKKTNFDLSYILSKEKNTEWEKMWSILPDEICQIIFNFWKKLHIEYAKKFLNSISDYDLYKELRRRNQHCFDPTTHGHIDFYVKCMGEIGLLDVSGFDNTLVYSKSEIETGSEVVNLNIKNNLYHPELIIRADYYTVSDVYDSINTIVALNNANPEADEFDQKIVDFWSELPVTKKLKYCIDIFPKIKDNFFLNEHMTTNASKFNSLKQSTYDTIRNLLIGEDLENVINESIEDSNNSQELANEMADEIAEEDATDEMANEMAEEDATNEIEDDNMILI